MTVCYHERNLKLLWYLSLQHLSHDDAAHVPLTCNSDSLAQQDTSILLLLVFSLLSLLHSFVLITIARQDHCISPHSGVTATLSLSQATVTPRQPDAHF